MTWNMLGILAALASGLSASDAEESAREALGRAPLAQAANQESVSAEGDAGDEERAASPDPAEVGTEQISTDEGDAMAPTNEDAILLGEDVNALWPAVLGPAIQVLPLAICA